MKMVLRNDIWRVEVHVSENVRIERPMLERFRKNNKCVLEVAYGQHDEVVDTTQLGQEGYEGIKQNTSAVHTEEILVEEK